MKKAKIKSIFHKICIGLCSFVMLVCCGFAFHNLQTGTATAATIDATTRTESGLSFNQTEDYSVDARLTAFPKTFETYVKPSGADRQYGIISSYNGGASDQYIYSLEIAANGAPRLYYLIGGKVIDITFSANTLPTDGDTWVHLVITNDGTTARCYVNGEYVQSRTTTVSGVKIADYSYDQTSTNVPRIGGDHFSANRYFRGSVKGIELYSDVRTASEIKADYKRLQTSVPTGDNLIAAYDFTQAGRAYLSDLSGNDYDIDFTGDDAEGLTFTAEDTYNIDSRLKAAPKAFEAYFKFPDIKAHVGSIISSYYSNSAPCIRLDIRYSNGNYVPRLYYVQDDGSAITVTFTKSYLTAGEWIRLRIVHDGTYAYSYINGTQMERWTVSELGALTSAKNFRIGGDQHSANAEYFKGNIGEVKLYSNVAATTLLASYNFLQGTSSEYLKDLSGNGYNIDFTGDDFNEGLSFTATDIYEADADFKAIPKTYEAYVSLSGTSRQGVIFGNYTSNHNDVTFSFEVYSNGQPRVFYSSGGTTVNCTFTNTSLPMDGSWVHLAITHDGTTLTCYVNGVDVETKQDDTFVAPTGAIKKSPRVGGDQRPGNEKYFTGKIKGVEVYSDVRTADEIKADYERLLTKAPDGDNLLAAYNFTRGGRAYLDDYSQNGYHLDYSEDDDEGGVSFIANEHYEIKDVLADTPYTIEAEIYLPTEFSTTVKERGGVVVGSYKNGSTAGLSIEIHEDGKPRFYYVYADKTIIDWKVEADVRTGDWAHLAFTYDVESSWITCYIDGEKVASVDVLNLLGNAQDPTLYTDLPDITQNYIIGGDNRASNAQNFKGLIRSVTLYKDVRTAEEIAKDVTAQDFTDKNLLAHYDMPASAMHTDIADRTGNYNVDYYKTWHTDKDPVTNYAYSFAVVGDTQIVNEYDAKNNTSNMAKIYDWILANKDSKKIQHVFGLGDITNSVTTDLSALEWDAAQKQLKKLDDANLSYSLVRGNHDDTVLFNEHFNNAAYRGQFVDVDGDGIADGGFYKEDKVESSWKTLKVGEINYLLITLDYGADDAELAWAGGIIESFPNHKVIITTHAYMYRDGTRLSIDEVCPPSDASDWSVAPDKVYNDGDQLWDKFVSKYGNIFLVLSGHDPHDDVVTLQSKGVHGNTVTQMLVDAQGMDAEISGGTGMVCMLYFSADGKSIEVEWYSTIKEQYYKDSNQYKITLYDDAKDVHGKLTPNYDEYEHWKECSVCGERAYVEAHTYGDWVKTDSTDYEVGYNVKTCECGHEIRETILPKHFGNMIGASIRVGNPTGIRFKLRISQAEKDLVFKNNLTMGMFIFPAVNLKTGVSNLEKYEDDYANSSLTKLNFTFKESDLYQEEEGSEYWYVNGIMTNVYVQNFTREFVGIGYVATTANGKTTYRYSGFEPTDIIRSMHYVASKTYQDENAAKYRDLMVSFMEKTIYGAYGITESRVYAADGIAYTDTYKYGNSTWSSYEAMKAANPITLEVSSKARLTVGTSGKLPVTIKVNSTVVDVDLPFEYLVDSDIISLKGNTIMAHDVGVETIDVAYNNQSYTIKVMSTEELDGIILDGERDTAYGAFTETVDLNGDRWYTVSAVKRDSGIFIYTQGLFNSTFTSATSDSTFTPAYWGNTRFSFRVNGSLTFVLTAANQSYGADKFFVDVTKQESGKYLHTFEFFVPKAIIADWSDSEDVQLNYSWFTPNEEAAIMDDLIEYRYLANWGNNSTMHSAHRLGGMETAFNSLVDNLHISRDGLTTTLAPENGVIKFDGVVDANDDYGNEGVTSVSTDGKTLSANVRARIVDGDIYMAATITHNKVWSSYTTSWHMNDNLEFHLDCGEVIPIMFYGNADGTAKMILPAAVDDAKTTSKIVGDKRVTTIELYIEGDYGAVKARIGFNGAKFGWLASTWWNDFSYITTEGLAHPSIKNSTTINFGNGIDLDGVLNDNVWTNTVKKNQISVEKLNDTVSATAIGTKTEDGVLLGVTINHSKSPDTVLAKFGAEENVYWHSYMHLEIYFNGRKGDGNEFWASVFNYSSNNLVFSYCNTVGDDKNGYTSTFEIFVPYSAIGATAEQEAVSVAIAARVEAKEVDTGLEEGEQQGSSWTWLWNEAINWTFIHKITEDGIASNTLEYELNADGKSYTVVGLGNYSDSNVVIPAKHNGYNVTAIKASAFANCSTITGVEIPETIKTIGASAFSGCTKLTDVIYSREVHSQLQSIGEKAFYNCRSLRNITILDNVLEIGKNAFGENVRLTSVKLQNTADWYYSSDTTTSEGTALKAADLGNTGTAATYLRDTYKGYNWKQVYTITWSVDGKTSTTKVLHGATPTQTVPVKANYIFAGWSDSADGDILNSLPKATKSTTYYAIFTAADITALTLSGQQTSFAFGESLKGGSLVVKATLSDGSTRTLESSEYTLTSDTYNCMKVGTYGVTVEAYGFKKSYNVKVNEGTKLKVLMIGNSYADDTINYAYEIAKASGISEDNILIADLYIGSCTIDTHWANAQSGAAAYRYGWEREGWFDGSTYPNVSLNWGIMQQKWDFITFQQGSAKSGDINSYGNLKNLMDHVRDVATNPAINPNANPEVKFIWHQTWAYAKDSANSGFPFYGNNQMTMYNNILEALNTHILPKEDFVAIIPNGTAIQNARTSFIGDNLTRDDYDHLSHDVGRFIAAMNMVSMLTGRDLSELTWTPKDSGFSYEVTDRMLAVIKESVQNAQKNPYEITDSAYATIDVSSMYEFDWKPVGYAFWQSADATNYNKLITTAGNSKNFVASAVRFTQDDIPVGSVIVVADGYQFRPDAWATGKENAVQSSRPGNVTANYFEVTEAFWKGYTYRAFNVSKADGSSLLTCFEEAAAALKIYVPTAQTNTDPYYETDKALLGDIDNYERNYWFPTNGYYSSTDANHILTVYTTDATNGPNYLATPIFTRETLPVGSVIIVDADANNVYRYRPEGWVSADATEKDRATLVSNIKTTTVIHITEEWWGNYNYRGINFGKQSGAANQEVYEVWEHFRIYIRKEAMLFEGTGTASDPYLIKTADDLWALSNLTAGRNYGDSSIYYKLVNNITISGKWQPICYSGNPNNWIGDAANLWYSFNANFDGNGKTITYNIDNDSAGFAYGLFAGIGGYVHNLTLKGTMDIGGYSGGLAGIARNGARIENVTSNVNITGSGSALGGIVGWVQDNQSATFTNCTNNGTIICTHATADALIGGIVGRAYANVTYTNCKNTAAITATTTSDKAGVGGIAGEFSKNSTITGCTNSGTITCGGKTATVDYATNGAGKIVGINNVSYTIKFVNDDGTVLQSSSVQYNATPSYTGATPTKAQTAQYTYTFKGWDKTIAKVTGAATYTATYTSTVRSYNITWNVDGTTSTSTLTYGSTPSKTVTKAGYIFKGWSKTSGGSVITLPTVTGAATYYAIFEKGTAATLFSGSGTSASPYLIQTADDLLDLSVLTAGANYGSSSIYFKVTADITVSGKWQPICYSGNPNNWIGDDANLWYSFNANFDGDGHTITFNIDNDSAGFGYGLFAGIGGYVHNLTLNGTMDIGGYSGGLAGIARNNARIDSVTSNVNITGTGSALGGIVGWVQDSGSVTFTNCTNNGTITCNHATANALIGGIVGRAYADVTYTNCKNTAAITATTTSTKAGVGGIAGEFWKNSSITLCTNSGTIKCGGKTATVDYATGGAGKLVGSNNVLTNVLQGKTITASSDTSANVYSATYPYDKLIDGNTTSTRYSSKSNGGKVEATIDLGGSYRLYEFKIYMYSTGLKEAGDGIQIAVYNGKSWITVVNCADNAAMQAYFVEAGTNDWLVFDLGGVVATQVRFTTTTSATSTYVTYYEVECLGVSGSNLFLGKTVTAKDPDNVYNPAYYDYSVLTDGRWDTRYTSKQVDSEVQMTIALGSSYKLNSLRLVLHASLANLGRGVKIEVKSGSSWTTVINCENSTEMNRYFVQLGTNRWLDFNLNGITATEVRITIPGPTASATLIAFFELECFGTKA